MHCANPELREPTEKESEYIYWLQQAIKVDEACSDELLTQLLPQEPEKKQSRVTQVLATGIPPLQ